VIFGFNTDVQFSGIVYHVQTEAREADCLMETQVFVKGRCLGKCAVSYAAYLGQPGFSDDRIHGMLKEQHRKFVDAARQGFIEEELAAAEEAVANPAPSPAGGRAVAAKPAPAPPEIHMYPLAGVIGKGLTIECLQPAVAPDGSAVTLYLQVGGDGGPASEAQLTCRVSSGNSAPAYLYAQCGPGGMADVRLSLQGLDLANTGILVQASHRGRSVSRKFALTKK
jgi:hypothetical protein